MKYRWLSVIVLAALIMVLAGCSRPNTPQEVAQAFWQAMAEADADEVADLSTLVTADDFDGFERDWINTLPDFGRVVIEDNQAIIVTRLPTENGVAGERQKLETYLVRVDSEWLVDYQRTREAVVHPSALDGLVSDMSRLGGRLSDAFGQSSEELTRKMDDISKELEAYSDSVGQKAEKAMEGFSESIQDLLEELEESMDRALKKHQQAPDQDREALQQAILHIKKARSGLAEHFSS